MRKWTRTALFGLMTLKAQTARFFWWSSDYGANTQRLLKLFGCFIFGFTILYTLIPGIFASHYSFADRILSLPRTLFFTAATMLPLGLINIRATHGSLFGIFMVLANFIGGCFLLTVLAARLAVLFEIVAPDYLPSKKGLSMAGLRNFLRVVFANPRGFVRDLVAKAKKKDND